MLIYHAALCEDEFILWGETPRETAAPVVRRRRKNTPESDVLPYPYDAGAKAIEAGLAETTAALPPAPGKRGPAPVRYVWLPTCESGPVPSSPLIDGTEASGEIVFAPWAVSARILPDGEIVDLLAACSGRQLLAPGRIVGADLAWWCRVLHFAGTLVARQSYLPGVVESEGVYASRWIPVLRPEDNERMARLAEAMPAAARAVGADASGPPQTSSSLMTRRFIEKMTDAIVRSGALPDRNAPAPRRRAAGKNRRPSTAFTTSGFIRCSPPIRKCRATL